MSEAVLAADSATQEDKPKAYHCPSCSAALYSPYHTVCPVCAEPIELAKIEEALGKKVEVAGDDADGHSISPLTIGIAAAVVLGVVVAVVTALT